MDNIVKLNINELRHNMVLAEDLITSKGAIVLTKNTKLSNTNFIRIKFNHIKTAKVYASSINENAELLLEPESPKIKKNNVEARALDEIVNVIISESENQIKEKKEFKEFVQTYDKSVDNVKEYFDKISNGGTSSMNEIYNVANNIIESVNCKSDLFTYLRSLKNADDYTYTHCINVSVLCNLFGKWIGMSSESLKDITIAGMLHDIGKIKVDKNLLNKKEKLTDEEFEEIKKHATYGYEMVVNNSSINGRIKMAVLMHHEKVDGSGYPFQMKGKDIDDFAKIVCICDIFDAMITDRPYRDKICPFEVIKTLQEDSFDILETKYLLIFLENIAYNYLGSRVELSNGKKGEIVFINSGQWQSPIVKTDDNKFFDLSKDSSIEIVNVI